MGGDRVQDASRSQTWHQDAQDAKDANLIELGSGCKVDTCDATQIFADVFGYRKAQVWLCPSMKELSARCFKHNCRREKLFLWSTR